MGGRSADGRQAAPGVATWLTVALFATTPLAGPEIPSVYVELTGVSDRHRGRDAATAQIGETAASGLVISVRRDKIGAVETSCFRRIRHRRRGWCLSINSPLRGPTRSAPNRRDEEMFLADTLDGTDPIHPGQDHWGQNVVACSDASERDECPLITTSAKTHRRRGTRPNQWRYQMAELPPPPEGLC